MLMISRYIVQTQITQLVMSRMNGELAVAVDWFRQNGLMANPDKFQALILGSTNLDFTFLDRYIKILIY